MHSSRSISRRAMLPASRRLVCAALVAAMSAACAVEPESRQRVQVGTHAFSVELATTPATRQRGLMGRSAVDPDGGMLFVFESADHHCFWMHDTPVPLSIAFIDATGRIVALDDMDASTDTLHCPREPVLYALEVAQGGFERRDIVPGMRVEGLPASGRH